VPVLDYTAPTKGETQFVERPDGTRLRTVVSGSGDKTALLVHGYGAGADAWALVVERLTAEGMRVISFDQRGHGQSTIGSDGSGSTAMSSDVGAVLEHYDVTDGTLVGHSMGGFLSIAFLVGDNPAIERVGSVLLMATFAGDVNRDNAQNKLQIPLIKSGLMTKLVRFGPFGTAFVKSLVGDDYQPGMKDAFLSTFLKADHANLVPILQAMGDESRYGELDKIDLPCTVLVGDKDKTTPPFHTADLHAGIAGSKLVTLPGIGHGPNWEAPDQIAKEILDLAG